MNRRDYQDIVGGLIIAVIGLATLVFAQEYRAGTLVRMGPGYFPTALGMILAGLGVAIALPAFRRAGSFPQLNLRSFAVTMAAIVFFAATLRPLGLIAACFGTVILSSLAERDGTWPARLVLGLVITIITVVVFRFGLGMSLPLIGRGW